MGDKEPQSRATSNGVVGGSGISFPVKLIHNPGLSVTWTNEEQSILEDGLRRYALNSALTCYAHIAYLLENKTIRDVALRCRWMSEKNMDPSANPTRLYAREKIVAGSSDGILLSAIGGAVGELLEQNFQYLQGISANLASLKFEDNKELFCNARQNILDLLNNLSNAPNLPNMRRSMPPLPVSINEDLLNFLIALEPLQTLPM